MNIVYKAKSEYQSLIDSKEVAIRYQDHINTIANCLSRLSDAREQISYLHEVTQDNGDVAIELDEALLKLGQALATACEYRDLYAKLKTWHLLASTF